MKTREKQKNRNYWLRTLIFITLVYVDFKKPKSKNDLILISEFDKLISLELDRKFDGNGFVMKYKRTKHLADFG